MEPQGGHGQKEWRPQGGGQGGGQEPAIVHQPEGDNLHLESVLGGHASEDAFLEGRVDDRAQDAEVPWEEAGVVLNAVILLPAIGGVEGAHRAGQEDRSVGLHHHFSGRSSTLLQSCKKTRVSYKSDLSNTLRWPSYCRIYFVLFICKFVYSKCLVYCTLWTAVITS